MTSPVTRQLKIVAAFSVTLCSARPTTRRTVTVAESTRATFLTFTGQGHADFIVGRSALLEPTRIST